MSVSYERSLVTEPTIAQRREWLVTNGIGGFACGTIANELSRRYHGLLVAATEPPLGRRLLVAKVNEVIQYDGRSYALGTDRFADGTVSPAGFVYCASFSLDGSMPVWTYSIGDAVVEKRVWMEYGANTTYVRYRCLQARTTIACEVRAFANDRDFHATSSGATSVPELTPIAGGVRCVVHAGATPLYLTADGTQFTRDGLWYRQFALQRETERGLDDRDDHLSAGVFAFELAPGQSRTIVASDRADAAAEGAFERAIARDTSLRAAYASVHGAQTPPPLIERLTLAADQFVVARPSSGDDGMTIVAGYPWFGDWGRDTMIALPGLLLATGRANVARQILTTFAALVDRGMLPNALPERGSALSYNTVDAALWFVEAVAAYRDATADVHFTTKVFPTLEAIVDAYLAGTRYGIKVDRNGLVFAGEAGSQLTWMDARVDGVAVTPRVGKPVEISALWYNALARLATLARDIGRDGTRFDALAETTKAGFERFWNASRACLFDVLDTPAGNDASLRPNQLFAVALHHSPLEPERQRAVVAACASTLYVPLGMRSLEPADRAYVACYAGSPERRDAAYHQGTGWTWLLGAFASAHFRAFGDREALRGIFDALAGALTSDAFGTLPELCQPDAPFAADGAFAQAWSVGEILRAWHAVFGSNPSLAAE